MNFKCAFPWQRAKWTIEQLWLFYMPELTDIIAFFVEVHILEIAGHHKFRRYEKHTGAVMPFRPRI